MSIFGKLMWFFKAHQRLYILGLSFLFLTDGVTGTDWAIHG